MRWRSRSHIDTPQRLATARHPHRVRVERLAPGVNDPQQVDLGRDLRNWRVLRLVGSIPALDENAEVMVKVSLASQDIAFRLKSDLELRAERTDGLRAARKDMHHVHTFRPN